MPIQFQSRPSAEEKGKEMPPPQPFILTLRLDKATESLLTQLRTKYFPKHRNFLSAHITLFHALPKQSQPQYARILSNLVKSTSPFNVGVKNPFALGKKGVGINISSHRLRQLHDELLREFKAADIELTEQDRSRFNAHVTIQNKVEEKEAMNTLLAVKEEWKDTGAKAEGLVLWRYEIGGQWTWLEEYSFGKDR